MNQCINKAFYITDALKGKKMNKTAKIEMGAKLNRALVGGSYEENRVIRIMVIRISKCFDLKDPHPISATGGWP